MIRIRFLIQSISLHLLLCLIVAFSMSFNPKVDPPLIEIDLSKVELPREMEKPQPEKPTQVKPPKRDINRDVTEPLPKLLHTQAVPTSIKAEPESLAKEENKPLSQSPVETFSQSALTQDISTEKREHRDFNPKVSSHTVVSPNTLGNPSPKPPTEQSPGDTYLKAKLHIISEILKKHLGYPHLARRMGWEGTMVITFILTPQGEIRDVTIEKSTGYELLDKNAVEVLRRTHKLFPQPPTEVKIKIPVVYRLE